MLWDSVQPTAQSLFCHILKVRAEMGLVRAEIARVRAKTSRFRAKTPRFRAKTLIHPITIMISPPPSFYRKEPPTSVFKISPNMPH